MVLYIIDNMQQLFIVLFVWTKRIEKQARKHMLQKTETLTLYK